MSDSRHVRKEKIGILPIDQVEQVSAAAKKGLIALRDHFSSIWKSS